MQTHFFHNLYFSSIFDTKLSENGSLEDVQSQKCSFNQQYLMFPNIVVRHESILKLISSFFKSQGPVTILPSNYAQLYITKVFSFSKQNRIKLSTLYCKVRTYKCVHLYRECTENSKKACADLCTAPKLCG